MLAIALEKISLEVTAAGDSLQGGGEEHLAFEMSAADLAAFAADQRLDIQFGQLVFVNDPKIAVAIEDDQVLGVVRTPGQSIVGFDQFSGAAFSNIIDRLNGDARVGKLVLFQQRPN